MPRHAGRSYTAAPPASAGAAVVFLALTGFTVAFQLAVAAGAPWGHLTWGGRFPGALPPAMRAVAAFSALLLVALGGIVAANAGLLSLGAPAPSTHWMWVVVTYCALGVLANAVTPSKRARRMWLPVVGVMLVSSLFVALAS